MAAKKNKCPSCGERITEADFLCPNCELILDPSLAPSQPLTEVSVVRRLLEVPQRGVPSAQPPPKPQRQADKARAPEGATKVFSLPPSHKGVPIVIASLSKKALALSEFEAWVVSLIDGSSEAAGLAKKANIGELEMQVVLHQLNEKMVIDFADEPLADEPPLLAAQPTSTLPEEDEPFAAAAHMQFPESDEPPIAQGTELPPPPPSAPPPIALGTELPPPPPPASPPELRPADLRPPAIAPRPVASTASAPPYPTSRARPARRPPPAPPAPAAPSPEPVPSLEPPPLGEAPQRNTDPRIMAKGRTNQKVLDALKQVKRRDADVSPAAAPPKLPEEERNVADVLAAPTLQVALRMEQGGRFAEAIRFLEQAIAKSPDAPSLYNRLAIILMREKADFLRAEAMLRKAIDLAPENQVYETNLKQVLSRMAVRTKR